MKKGYNIATFHGHLSLQAAPAHMTMPHQLMLVGEVSVVKNAKRIHVKWIRL